MLDLTSKGTCNTSDGIVWDYYGDDSNPAVFYVVPIPTLARGRDGVPLFSLVEYSTATDASGTGYCYLSTVLWIPPNDLPQIEAAIKQRYPGVTPRLTTLQFRQGGQAAVRFVANDGATSREVYTRTSSYGANVATFLVALDAHGVAVFKAAFGGTAPSGISVVYEVAVPSRLPAVKVTVKFDSAIAYEYQKTHTVR